MKRVFIAIDISPEARAKVSEYIERLKRSGRDLRVGWEKPEKLHLTLNFLGDVDDHQLAGIEQAVKTVASQFAGFRSRIYGNGRFPPKGDPRILWLGLTDDGTLSKVAHALGREMAKIGFEPEKRKFHPHLTIARLREPRRSTALAAAHTNNKFQGVDFEVKELVLYESRLHPGGSVYSRLAAFPLRGAS
jgi:RNA 2',3'-cyclic 3'-phosphodiesterase